MNTDIDERIVDFLENQKEYFSKTFFGTREITDAVGLTIYQTRGHLEVLQSSGVVEKINSGRGRPGMWRLHWAYYRKSCFSVISYGPIRIFAEPVGEAPNRGIVLRKYYFWHCKYQSICIFGCRKSVVCMVNK